MSVEGPGYRLLFKDSIEYDDLLLILAPVATSVVEDPRLWSYTKGIAGRMRNTLRGDQRAIDLLDFIHDRRKQHDFIVLLGNVLQDQSDLIGYVREETGFYGGSNSMASQIIPSSSKRWPPITSESILSAFPSTKTSDAHASDIVPPKNAPVTAPVTHASTPNPAPTHSRDFRYQRLPVRLSLATCMTAVACLLMDAAKHVVNIGCSR